MLELSVLSEALRSELPVLSLRMLLWSRMLRFDLLLLTMLRPLWTVSVSSEALLLADSYASNLSAAPKALCWCSPVCTLVVLLLSKKGCWSVSRSTRRCSELASRGCGRSGKTLRRAAGSAKKPRQQPTSLVLPLPPTSCLPLS